VILYQFIYWTGRLLFPLLVDIRVFGRGHIPRTGPVLLVSNHLSYADPLLLSALCPRRIFFLAKSELFEQSRLFAWLIRRLGSVPIRRDGHAGSAIRRAERILDEGKVVGIFPEGGITTPGELKAGVALIAARTGATIVPVRLSGTPGLYAPEAYLLRARRVRVTFGRPIRPHDVGDPSDRKGFSKRLLDAIGSHIVR